MTNEIRYGAGFLVVFALACTDEGSSLNIPPLAVAGSDQVVGPLDEVLLDGGRSRDEDGEITGHLWVQSAGPAVALEQEGAIARFTATQVAASLAFTLLVTDNDGAVDRAEVLVTVEDGQQPRANAGVDRDVLEGVRVRLDGTASQDPDGVITSYGWAQTAGSVVAIDELSPGLVSFITPFTAPDELVFHLTVTDDDMRLDTDEVRIQVVANLPPLADAGEDQVVGPGDFVQLDGSSSLDPDGQIVAYRWAQVAGIPVELSDADAPTPSFTAPRNVGVLSFSLTVTDDGGAEASDDVAIVAGGTPPELRVTFPTEGGDFEGARQRIVVSGWVADPDGSGIRSVTVNSREAQLELEVDGRWSADVPIEFGRTDLHVVATDVAGETTEVETWVQNQPSFRQPQGLAIDPDGEHALVLDLWAGLMEVDLDSGDRRRLYGSREAPFLQAVSFDVDWSTRVAFVSDTSRRIIAAIDLETLVAGVLSGPSVGGGPELVRPVDLRVDSEGDVLYVLDQGTSSLVEIELQTGVRRLVGSDLLGGVYLDVDPSSRRAVVVGNEVIYDIELDTMSVRTIGSEQLTLRNFLGVLLRADTNELLLIRDGVFSFDLESLVFERQSSNPPPIRRGLRQLSDSVFLGTGEDELIRVDLSSGAHTSEAGLAPIGTGLGLGLVRDTAPTPDGRGILAAVGKNNPRGSELVLVDPATGNRSLVAFVSGGSLGASGLDVDPAGARAVLASERPGRVDLVDLTTGEVSVVPTDIGGRRVLVQPGGGRAYLTSAVGTPGAVYDLDLQTGDYLELSGPDRGQGVSFNVPLALGWSSAPGANLLVGDFPVLWEVDAATGDRTIILGRGVGRGVQLASLGHLIPDPQVSERLFIADNNFGLIAFDRTTATSRLVDEIPGLNGFEVDPTERRAYSFRSGSVGASGVLLSIDLRTGQTVVSSR
ncbi:MAG: PKD domain-containing protein [Myxococcota bacterium]